LAVDSSGAAYVAGSAASPDFPITAGAFQPSNHISSMQSGLPVNNQEPPLDPGALTNAFAAKLSPDGSALEYSTYLGGSGAHGAGDNASALAIDGSGNFFVAGVANSTDFPVTPGAFQSIKKGTAQSGANGYVTELNSSGTAVVFSTYLGGSGNDAANAIALDTSGNIYVSGAAGSADFPVTAGAYQATSRGQNAFVTELNPAGSGLIYSTFLGGDGPDGAWAMALDSSDDVYAAGGTWSSDFPVAASFQTTNHGAENAFVAKMQLTGTPTLTPTITGSASSPTIGSEQPVTITVTVKGGAGSPTPTGTVTLIDIWPLGGTNTYYSSQPTALSGGSASITIPGGTLLVNGLGATVDPLKALYIPDATSTSLYAFSSSSDLNVTVVAPSFQVTPTNIPWIQTESQDVPLTVTVTSQSGLPVPTGTVNVSIWVLDGPSVYTSGAVPLSGGAATVTIPAGTLNSGSYEVSGTYSGDSNYAADSLASYDGVGFGVGSPSSPIFAIRGAALTVTAGALSGNTSTITVVPGGGFTGSVTLTAAVSSGPTPGIDPPTLSFGSTSPVTIADTSAGSATLTVSTTPATSGCTQSALIPGRVPWYTSGGMVLACLFLFGLPGRRRRWRSLLGMFVLLAALTASGLGCGGGAKQTTCPPIQPGTTPGAYTITVTGTSGTTTAATTVALTVQ
jgi:hypothetical protein